MPPLLKSAALTTVLLAASSAGAAAPAKPLGCAAIETRSACLAHYKGADPDANIDVPEVCFWVPYDHTCHQAPYVHVDFSWFCYTLFRYVGAASMGTIEAPPCYSLDCQRYVRSEYGSLETRTDFYAKCDYNATLLERSGPEMWKYRRAAVSPTFFEALSHLILLPPFFLFANGLAFTFVAVFVGGPIMKISESTGAPTSVLVAFGAMILAILIALNNGVRIDMSKGK
jgi:hypothetical protein